MISYIHATHIPDEWENGGEREHRRASQIHFQPKNKETRYWLSAARKIQFGKTIGNNIMAFKRYNLCETKWYAISGARVVVRSLCAAYQKYALTRHRQPSDTKVSFSKNLNFQIIIIIIITSNGNSSSIGSICSNSNVIIIIVSVRCSHISVGSQFGATTEKKLTRFSSIQHSTPHTLIEMLSTAMNENCPMAAGAGIANAYNTTQRQVITIINVFMNEL